MGYNIIITLLLCAHVSAVLPSFEVAPAKKFSFYQNRKASLANSTIPFLVQTPSYIRQTVQIKILKGDSCSVIKNEINITLGVNINLVTNYTQIVSSSWQIQIMSFEYGQNTVYMLLDNGTLVTAQFDFNAKKSVVFSLISHKSYSREAIGAVDTWLQSHHSLVLFQGKLFVLAQQKLSQVTIHKEGYWTKEITPIGQKVVKAKVVDDKLYLLTSASLLEYANKKVNTVKKGERFVDFSIIDKVIYILVKDKGILQFQNNSQASNSAVSILWQIQKPQHAIKLRGIGSTIFVIYEIKHKNYIAQYFIQKGNLTLNKYYHNYYSVKDIHLTKNYAIIDAYSSYTILRHSVNRNSFKSFATLETIYKSPGAKISGILLLPQLSQFSYLVGTKTGVYQQTAISNLQNQNGLPGLNQLALACNSEESKTVELEALYIGLCSQFWSEKEFYCEGYIKHPIVFEYSSVKNAQNQGNLKLKILIILAVLAAIFFFVCLICGKNLCIQQFKIQQKIREYRNKKQTYAVKKQQTFQNLNQEIKK